MNLAPVIMNNTVFGSEYKDLFNVGDLVSWKALGEKENYGLILEIFEKKMGNRNILVAKIDSFTDKRHRESLLSSLTCISSVKKQQDLIT